MGRLRANPQKYVQELLKIEWNQLDQLNDLESMVTFWNKSNKKVLDILAPLSTRKVSKKKVKELPPDAMKAQRKYNKMKKDLREKTCEKLFNCSQCDKTFNVADKDEVRAYRKQRKF